MVLVDGYEKTLTLGAGSGMVKEVVRDSAEWLRLRRDA